MEGHTCGLEASASRVFRNVFLFPDDLGHRLPSPFPGKVSGAVQSLRELDTTAPPAAESLKMTVRPEPAPHCGSRAQAGLGCPGLDQAHQQLELNECTCVYFCFPGEVSLPKSISPAQDPCARGVLPGSSPDRAPSLRPQDWGLNAPSLVLSLHRLVWMGLDAQGGAGGAPVRFTERKPRPWGLHVPLRIVPLHQRGPLCSVSPALPLATQGCARLALRGSLSWEDSVPPDATKSRRLPKTDSGGDCPDPGAPARSCDTHCAGDRTVTWPPRAEAGS